MGPPQKVYKIVLQTLYHADRLQQWASQRIHAIVDLQCILPVAVLSFASALPALILKPGR